MMPEASDWSMVVLRVIYRPVFIHYCATKHFYSCLIALSHLLCSLELLVAEMTQFVFALSQAELGSLELIVRNFSGYRHGNVPYECQR